MSHRVRAKICGLTRVEDVRLAVALGADAIGFIFWPASPRVVTVEQARHLSSSVPPLVARVGVFVNLPPRDVALIAADVGLDVIQLHGEESPSEYAGIGRRLLKSVSLPDDEAVETIAHWPEPVTPLIDSYDPVRRGGTGRVANWPRASALAARRPVVLAGGLTPDNVGEGIRAVRPWAVDVSSGVEATPGIKSPDRLRAFLGAVAAENARS